MNWFSRVTNVSRDSRSQTLDAKVCVRLILLLQNVKQFPPVASIYIQSYPSHHPTVCFPPMLQFWQEIQKLYVLPFDKALHSAVSCMCVYLPSLMIMVREMFRTTIALIHIIFIIIYDTLQCRPELVHLFRQRVTNTMPSYGPSSLTFDELCMLAMYTEVWM